MRLSSLYQDIGWKKTRLDKKIGLLNVAVRRELISSYQERELFQETKEEEKEELTKLSGENQFLVNVEWQVGEKMDLNFHASLPKDPRSMTSERKGFFIH